MNIFGCNCGAVLDKDKLTFEPWKDNPEGYKVLMCPVCKEIALKEEV